MSKRWLLLICVLIAGLFLGGPAAVGPATRATGADTKPADDPASKSFFAQHCQACHAGAKPKGKFRLDSLTQDFDDKANRERWLAVLEQVKNGTMPPKERPRPQAKDIATLTEWIGGRVATGETARNAAQGRVAMRRLNRAEYLNTVRDLLAVDIDLKDLLPIDDASSGFDNSAEALHVSSYLMENYLEAADRVLEAAIAGGPKPQTNKMFKNFLRNFGECRSIGVERGSVA